MPRTPDALPQQHTPLLQLMHPQVFSRKGELQHFGAYYRCIVLVGGNPANFLNLLF
jgi:hypothetical protein